MENIKKCFDMLGLPLDARLEEVKQAYRDQINVWHPDRFQNNPRLQTKATEKLKELNEAYSIICEYIKTGDNFVTPEEETTQTSTSDRQDDQASSSSTDAKQNPKPSSFKQQFLQGMLDTLNRPVWMTVLTILMMYLVKYALHENRTSKKAIQPTATQDTYNYSNSYNNQPLPSQQINTYDSSNTKSVQQQPHQQEITSNENTADSKLSIEQSDPEALFKLARKYYRGDGVPRDEGKAVSYYKLAAKQGHVEATEFLKVLGVSAN